MLKRLMAWFFDLEPPPLRVSSDDSASRLARHSTLDDDPAYRARVKQRMLEGAACPLPPLYQRPAKARRRRPRADHVVIMAERQR